LRHPEDPKGASNRRISVIVQYLPPATEAKGTPPPEKPKEKPEKPSEKPAH
jgi:hypothetical protein